jgi:hypothetical protein
MPFDQYEGVGGWTIVLFLEARGVCDGHSQMMARVSQKLLRQACVDPVVKHIWCHVLEDCVLRC